MMRSLVAKCHNKTKHNELVKDNRLEIMEDSKWKG